MGFFSKFKSKDKEGGVATPKSKKTKNAHTNGAVPAPPPRPHWDDAWTRKVVEPEEIQELLRGCTHEMKSRGMPGISINDYISHWSLSDHQRSARHAVPPSTIQTSLRPKRSAYFHPELLQHGEGCRPQGRPPGARIDIDRANGKWA